MSNLVPFSRVRGSVMDPFAILNPATLQSVQPFLSPILELQRREMRALNPIEADVIEKADGTFFVHCDLPGVDPKGEFAFP